MANKTIYNSELKNRRQELKKQRQWRNFIAFLRAILMMSLFGGVFWFFTLPNWVIKDSKQIKVEGNNLLSDEEIRSVIPLDYPSSLIKLSTANLAHGLEQKIPVGNILITKQILPPNLTIKVKEKKPVAVALEPRLSPETKKITIEKTGYIDEDGILVSNELYQNLQSNPEKIPALQIIGSPQIYLAYWAELYQLVRQSPVQIKQIDWQNPSNLVLITDLGKVYLGGYTSKFPQQLTMLEKMQAVTQKVPREKILYIDLTDPEIPAIKEKK